MEAICPSEISVDFQRTARSYMLEHNILHRHCFENLKSNKTGPHSVWTYAGMLLQVVSNRTWIGSLNPHSLIPAARCLLLWIQCSVRHVAFCGLQILKSSLILSTAHIYTCSILNLQCVLQDWWFQDSLSNISDWSSHSGNNECHDLMGWDRSHCDM
jgi:hypothetical protein